MKKIKEKIAQSIKSKTLFQNLFYICLLKLNICSKSTIRSMRNDRAYYKLKKIYEKKIKKDCEFEISNSDDNYIWIFWYQGLENAPELIKNCYNSVVNKLGKKNRIIVLTKDNYQNYVDIPQYILKKLESKHITITHFSDILRLALLVKYGGLWLDATVYCSGCNELEKINKNELFVYRDSWWEDNVINMGNWLIYAKKNNIILKKTLQLLYEYWKKNDYILDYFLFHLFFRMVSDNYANEWKKIPYFTQINNHLLAYEMEMKKEYDEKRIANIFRLTDFHKLSYKTGIDNEDNNIYIKLIKKDRTK